MISTGSRPSGKCPVSPRPFRHVQRRKSCQGRSVLLSIDDDRAQHPANPWNPSNVTQTCRPPKRCWPWNLDAAPSWNNRAKCEDTPSTPSRTPFWPTDVPAPCNGLSTPVAGEGHGHDPTQPAFRRCRARPDLPTLRARGRQGTCPRQDMPPTDKLKDTPNAPTCTIAQHRPASGTTPRSRRQAARRNTPHPPPPQRRRLGRRCGLRAERGRWHSPRSVGIRAGG